MERNLQDTSKTWLSLRKIRKLRKKQRQQKQRRQRKRRPNKRVWPLPQSQITDRLSRQNLENRPSFRTVAPDLTPHFRQDSNRSFDWTIKNHSHSTLSTSILSSRFSLFPFSRRKQPKIRCPNNAVPITKGCVRARSQHISRGHES